MCQHLTLTFSMIHGYLCSCPVRPSEQWVCLSVRHVLGTKKSVFLKIDSLRDILGQWSDCYFYTSTEISLSLLETFPDFPGRVTIFCLERRVSICTNSHKRLKSSNLWVPRLWCEHTVCWSKHLSLNMLLSRVWEVGIHYCSGYCFHWE